MKNLTTIEVLPVNCVMTLKNITDLLPKTRHDKAMKKVLKLAENESFGAVSKMDSVYNEQGQIIKTLALTKKQCVAAAAKLRESLERKKL